MQFDGNTTLLIAIGIIALVAIVYAVRYGGSGKTKINGPFGLSVEAEGRNPAKAARPSPQPKPEPPPADNVAVDLEDVKVDDDEYHVIEYQRRGHGTMVDLPRFGWFSSCFLMWLLCRKW